MSAIPTRVNPGSRSARRSRPSFRRGELRPRDGWKEAAADHLLRRKNGHKATARWYHARSARLSEEFLQAVDKATEQLLQFPESGPLIYRTLRMVLLDKFPYSLFYAYDPGRVRVIAVMHWRRDPEVWQARAP